MWEIYCIFFWLNWGGHIMCSWNCTDFRKPNWKPLRNGYDMEFLVGPVKGTRYIFRMNCLLHTSFFIEIYLIFLSTIDFYFIFLFIPVEQCELATVECVHLCVLSHFSHVRLFASSWTVAYHAALFIEFSRQEYWWVTMPSSRGSSRSRDRIHISYLSCIGRRVLYH